MCVLYKLKARPSISKKIITHFIIVVWNQTHNISKVMTIERTTSKPLSIQLLGASEGVAMLLKRILS